MGALDDLLDVERDPLSGIENDPHLAATAWLSKSLHLYATGYRKAAEVVFESVDASRRHQDTMIYPFVFMWRQHIELMLKLVIDEYAAFLESTGEEVMPLAVQAKRANGKPLDRITQLSSMFGVPKTHSLDDLWTEARYVIAKVVGEDASLSELDTVVSELSKQDPDSEHFRFPVKRDGSETVKPGDDLHWGVIHKQMGKLSELLDTAAIDLSVRRDRLSEVLAMELEAQSLI